VDFICTGSGTSLFKPVIKNPRFMTTDNEPEGAYVHIIGMEYRGKHYTIVQGIGPDSWKWSVYLDEKSIKSGESKTRVSAKTSAVWLIDKALSPKKAKMIPPAD
jgi:hypothetical protein